MEIFKDVFGYEGLYKVSNYGNVISLNYRKTGVESLMKPRKTIANNMKYCQVVLYKDGNHKTVRVHRLVAIAFLENPNNLPQVNHIDNNPLNNHVSNLEWVTDRQNKTHRWGMKKTSSSHTGVSWYKRDKMWLSQICVNGKTLYIGRFVSELEAAKAYQNRLNQLTNA